MWNGNIKLKKASEDKENVAIQFYTYIASFVLVLYKTNNKQTKNYIPPILPRMEWFFRLK